MKATITFALLFVAVNASAQVPPHKPGQICFSPAVNWCWNQTSERGEIGKSCKCMIQGHGFATGRFTATESETDYQARLNSLGLKVPNSTDATQGTTGSVSNQASGGTAQ